MSNEILTVCPNCDAETTVETVGDKTHGIVECPKCATDYEIEDNMVWNYNLYDNGELDCDSCPNCGKEGFINAQITVGAQYAQKGQYDGDYDIDDMSFQELTHATCGNCGIVLKD